ncbi:MAG TPA: hypothetical protein VJU16_05665, partial [Planctomycetota bacterium]|nr:hypothetical protein [Planctomycetota bacterium]
MNNAKRVNAFLWIGNVVLIVGIVAFAFQFLILPETRTRDVEAPISMPLLNNPVDVTDTTALGKLANPLIPKVVESPTTGPTGPIRLIGTDSIVDDPTSHVAYLEILARKLNVNAYVGEPVRDESTGLEVPELRDHKLKSVTPKTATFTYPGGEKTLQIEEITASPSTGTGPLIMPGAAAGTPWDPAKYTTKKNPARTNDTQEAWDIDRKEVEWAAANIESILQGVSLEPYAGGGLKINALPEGGFAAERGLRSGDVI